MVVQRMLLVGKLENLGGSTELSPDALLKTPELV